MNVFHKVTLQSLKKNRVRTLVTIIGIMLSTALICAVTTSFASVRQYAIDYLEFTDGKWHAMEKNASKSTYDLIACSGKVKETGEISLIGYAKIGSSNKFKPYICVSGFREDEDRIIPIHLTSGRMPENENEIILPDHLNFNGDVGYGVGDELTLEIGDRKINKMKLQEIGIDDLEKAAEMYGSVIDKYVLGQDVPYAAMSDNDDENVISAEDLDIKEIRSYTVVGIYQRPAFEDFTAPGYTALTVADEYTDDTQLTVYYCMNDASEVYDFINNNDLNGETHSTLLMFKGISMYSSFYSMIYGLMGVVIVLIMFGSVMLIYNAFSISVSERTKQFGLLSSVGATKRQLRKMVRFEAASVSFIGIPLGILLGIVGMWITFLAIGNRFSAFIGDEYRKPMRICISFKAIAAACIIAFITIMLSAWIPSRRATKISAVEAIRQNSDIKQKKRIRTPQIIYKFFGLSGVLAHKYFKRSKKKYRSTIISLFMSIVLFISASSFTAYLVGAASDSNDNLGMDYVLTLYDENNYNNPTEANELKNRILSTENITDVAYFSSQYSMGAYLKKDCLSEEFLNNNNNNTNSRFYAEREGYITADMTIFYVDDDTYRQLLAKYNLSEDEFMNKESPLGIAVDNIMSFDDVSGRMVRRKAYDADRFDMIFSQVKQIDGYYFSYIDDNNAVYFNMEEPENSISIPADECVYDIVLKIGKVIEERPYFTPFFYNAVIYPYSAKGFLPEDEQENINVIEYAIKSSDKAAGYDALSGMMKECGYSDYDLFNYAAQADSQRSMIIIIKVFAYGFIVLISLIAAANVFNTITTNINLRRREFAMLKSVGMTAKGMRKMLNFECILYGTKALIYGLPTSFIVTYFIYRSINEGFDTVFFIPWKSVIIAVMSVFIVVFVTMMFSMSKIKKDNPIDSLKNENL